MSTNKGNIKRAHLFVSGKVQGVFFRANTKDVAIDHGLSGWAKNCLDGSVEVILEGNADQVERVINWCRKGPAAAQVADVEIKWEKPTGEYDAFSIRY